MSKTMSASYLAFSIKHFLWLQLSLLDFYDVGERDTTATFIARGKEEN